LVGPKCTEWFDEPWHVVFWADGATLARRSRFGGIIVATTGPLIDDAALACVLKLPHIKSLDLAFSNVSDAGLEPVSHLEHLEKLRLEGCDISNLSIPILSRMRTLKILNVEDTQITIAGARELEAALPGCDVRGPHNDKWNLFFQSGRDAGD
jgi:Leucine-rich repeat (LRR) protein